MNMFGQLALLTATGLLSGAASASLNSAGTFNGHVGLSVDGIGSNSTPVGLVQAEIPITATILRAYLYSAGVPIFPGLYPNSPNTLADYNTAGISLAGNAITNFDTLVGATSPRADIVAWHTGRADVTTLVQSLRALQPATSSFNWAVTEGDLRNRSIDGEVLVIVYSDASKPLGSVALLDGGQDTAGETTRVTLGAPLTDPGAPGFAAELGFGISFSCCGDQKSSVSVNGSSLTDNAGNFDDGLLLSDGALITVGGLGDTPANLQSYANDHELYDLRPFLHTGDTSFTIDTLNASGDDNIFFASLYLTGEIKDVTPNVPEPGSFSILLAGLAALGAMARRSSGR